MDLKFKGTRWVGNIYQKFEAMCHEVDDFVSHDTVKYVENQVQTVGNGVKRFYSGVVQDLIPSSLVEIGEHEAQAVSSKQNDTIGTYISSMLGIEEKPAYNDFNQPSMKQDSIDPIKNSHEQFIHPPAACFLESDSDLSSGQGVDASRVKKSDIVFQENDTEELKDKKSDIVVEENDTQEELIFKKSDSFDKENDTKKELIDEKLDIAGDENDRKGELIVKKPNTVIEENDAEDLIGKKSDIVFEENNTKEELIEKKSDLSEVSLLNEFIDEKNGILAEVLPATLVCNTQKDEIDSNRFLDEVKRVSDISSLLPSSETGFSVVFGEEDKTAELGHISSSSSRSTEYCTMSEFFHANVLHNNENICCNTVDVIGCVSDLSDTLASSQTFPIDCRDNKVADMRLSFSSSALTMESNYADSSTTDDAACTESSGSRHDYCYECTQLEALMTSLEMGEEDDCAFDINDPSTETIELSDKATPDESCVVVDNKLLYAVSCRGHRYRSYKKILLDAFASKKRLRKEYRMLSILYGDIDIELNQQPGRNHLPCIPTSSVDSINSLPHDLCDPEWELL